MTPYRFPPLFHLFLLALSVDRLQTANAFFGSKPTTSKSSTSPLTQQALDIYNKAFPFDREPPKANPLGDFGMPYTDIDGTILNPAPSRKNKDPTKKSRRLTDVSRDRAAKTFNVLVNLYGEQRAFSMVKIQPICLCFDSNQFQPSLEAWTEVFGLEASQDMVARNPGLLAVRSDEAARSDGSTMAFSYLVAITRPVGPLLLAGLLFLIFTPAIEGITGIKYGINH